MRREIILIPEALLDVKNAYDWYEQQDPGLGEEFIRCLEAAYAKISVAPEHYPIRFDSFRRILIRRFPFAVYFENDDKHAWIYYVFHCSLNPERLRERLSKG